MEKKITMKSTKQEIMEAYEAAIADLEKKKIQGDDPVKEAAEMEKERVIASAVDAIDQGIFSDALISKYQDILKAIDIKQDELTRLFGIRENADNMAAMINAHRATVERIEAERKEVQAEYDTMIEAKREEISSLCEKLESEKVRMDAEEEEYKLDLKKKRDREEEEYTYNLGKTRAREKDLWDAEREIFEKEIEQKKLELSNGLAELAAKKEEVENLRKQVEQIPNLIKEAEEKATSELVETLEKQKKYEIAAIKKDCEYQVKMEKNDNVRLAIANEELQAEIANTKQKLDDAYNKINALAADTVKASGGIRIVDPTTYK